MADFGSLVAGFGGGGFIGRAIVALDLDTKKYQAEMKAAQAQTQAGTTSLGQKFSALGSIAKAGLLAGAAGIVAFGVSAVKAASDLGEQVNRSNVIFGRNADEIREWAETGARAFGLSTTAALEAAGGFGAMLQTAGVATDASAKMSQALVELAGDMASFNNIDPTEALEKLRSGLAGEAEPLRRFGVFLSEAAVQQEAYTSGLARTGEELTEAQKVQARYNLIFEQTTKQQGDFQRTADSLPNLLRTLKAEFVNTAAAVGEDLLPAIEKIVGIITDYALPAFEGLIEALKTAFDPNTYTSIPVIGEIFESLGDAVEETKRVLNESFGVGRKTAAMLVPHSSEWIGHGINATGEAMASFTIDIDKNVIALGEHIEATRKAHKEVAEFAGMSGEELKEWRVEAKESLRTAILGFEDLSSQSDITKRDLIRGFREMREDAEEFRKAMRELGQKSNEWVPEAFRVYLKDLGPAALIAFADANQRQKERMVSDWEEASRSFNRSIGGSFIDLKGALNELDNKVTKHVVRVKYEYEGFDPTKPGMAGSNQAR